MKTITFQTAVMLAVNELLALGPFSAYEATTLIRARVDNDYEISDADPHGYAHGTDVPHSRVRDIITELFDNGIFNATKSYGNSRGNTYTIYNPIVATTPVCIPVTTTSTPNPLATSIRTYLNNKGNTPSTIKQIQSALKLKGVTCDDIFNLIPKGNIVRMDSSISKIQVKISN